MAVSICQLHFKNKTVSINACVLQLAEKQND